jgi:hypothetical protein
MPIEEQLSGIYESASSESLSQGGRALVTNGLDTLSGMTHYGN